MKYTANAHIEDGQVLCACSDCEGCDFRYFNKCVAVEITCKDDEKGEQA